MVTIESVENIYWISEEHNILCATVKFSDLLYKYATSLTANEKIEIRQQLYVDIVNGVWGQIGQKPSMPTIVVPQTI